jgi:cyclophilin family peptidyl-prolyl cis-trans isomerase
MVLDLFQDDAPVTVNNFVFLALQRYYDGIVFHRVLEDFMAQTGDPTGTGRGGPGYQFGDEFVPGLRHDGQGRAVDGERRPRHQRLAVLHHLHRHAVARRQARGVRPRGRGASRCSTPSPASTPAGRAARRPTVMERVTSTPN